MSKAGSAAKVKLNSFDDLFGASDMTAGTDQVQEIPLQSFMSSKDTLLRCWMMKRCRKQWRASETMVCLCRVLQDQGQRAVMR